MALEQAPQTAQEAVKAGLEISFEHGYISKQIMAQRLREWLKPVQKENDGNRPS